jgi:hypothetical protein
VKTQPQRISDAACKAIHDKFYGVLSDDVCLSLSLAEVTRWLECQDDANNPERLVKIAIEAADLIREKYRQYAAIRCR